MFPFHAHPFGLQQSFLAEKTHQISYQEERFPWDFPGGPVVKNLPSNAGDVGSIPGQGTKIPHAIGQLSPRAATTDPAHSGARLPQQKTLHATTKTRCSQINK